MSNYISIPFPAATPPMNQTENDPPEERERNYFFFLVACITRNEFFYYINLACTPKQWKQLVYKVPILRNDDDSHEEIESEYKIKLDGSQSLRRHAFTTTARQLELYHCRPSSSDGSSIVAVWHVWFARCPLPLLAEHAQHNQLLPTAARRQPYAWMIASANRHITIKIILLCACLRGR